MGLASASFARDCEPRPREGTAAVSPHPGELERGLYSAYI